MSDEQTPQEPQAGAAALTEAAGHVSDQAEAVARQIALLRAELRAARDKAEADLNEAKQQAADDVAAERRDRRLAAWKFAVVVGLDVILSLGSLGLYYSQVQTNHRLETSLKQNYTTAQVQAETRVKVLCPLYEVLIAASENPNPQATSSPAGRARLEQAVATIRAGYTTLGCTPALPTPSLPSG